jgi:hypothetical protein
VRRAEAPLHAISRFKRLIDDQAACVVEVAVANGAHNQLVTFDPAGPEAEARLGRKEISVDVLIEAGDLGEQSRPLGPLVEAAMKIPVQTCPLQRIGRLRRLHQNRFLMLEISARERRRGVPQRMGFERRAKLRNFQKILLGNLRDGDPAIGLKHRQPVGDQTLERFAHRSNAHAKPGSDVVLLELRAACYRSQKDRAPELLD